MKQISEAMPLKNKRNPSASDGIKMLLSVFWILAVIMPLLAMFSRIADTDVFKLISSERFLTAAVNSVTVSAAATAVSVSLAGLLAWCTARTAFRFRSIFTVIFTVPMLIPSISHGMGLIILFGSNGIITNLLGTEASIYGFTGIVAGSVMYSFPVAYIMLFDILRQEDSTPYEAADVMGLSSFDKLKIITVPYLKKPLISVLFATFTMIITDYGVPLMIGGKYITLPVMMYQDVIGMLDFGKGSVIGIILLIPAFLACLMDILSHDRGNSAFIIRPFDIKPQRIRDISAGAICITIAIFLLLPIITFSCVGFVRRYPVDMSLSLENVQQALDMNVGRYLANSVFIAASVSFIGVILAIICAYFTARMPSKFSKLLHLLSIASLAVPGIVLGLSYALFFRKSFIYGTFAMLILVNTMHFFSSPYLMMYNTFCKLNPNLEDVGRTLGISRIRIITDVLLSMSKGTILEMVSYFFINSMMTISAVSFLAAASTKPLAMMIPQFEGQMQLECAAFISFIILTVNLLIKIAVFAAKRYLTKH